ncbi:hypothetical protein DENSPDRAFT_835124 [Dentipellis sp. KUC8613]|nr:hypothetical protein DENSPDRAFT_835124 [Dentipellis sp. KUC8613]
MGQWQPPYPLPRSLRLSFFNWLATPLLSSSLIGPSSQRSQTAFFYSSLLQRVSLPVQPSCLHVIPVGARSNIPSDSWTARASDQYKLVCTATTPP